MSCWREISFPWCWDFEAGEKVWVWGSFGYIVSRRSHFQTKNSVQNRLCDLHFLEVREIFPQLFLTQDLVKPLSTVTTGVTATVWGWGGHIIACSPVQPLASAFSDAPVAETIAVLVSPGSPHPYRRWGHTDIRSLWSILSTEPGELGRHKMLACSQNLSSHLWSDLSVLRFWTQGRSMWAGSDGELSSMEVWVTSEWASRGNRITYFPEDI